MSLYKVGVTGKFLPNYKQAVAANILVNKLKLKKETAKLILTGNQKILFAPLFSATIKGTTSTLPKICLRN